MLFRSIPWRTQDKINQAGLHNAEMNQENAGKIEHDEIFVMNNFDSDYKIIKVETAEGGHGGGDSRLQDKIFRFPDMADPLHHAAGTRDGAMSCLIGIAARKSIDEKRTVRIEELTDLQPHATRGIVLKKG